MELTVPNFSFQNQDHSLSSAISRVRVTLLLTSLHLSFAFRVETITHSYLLSRRGISMATCRKHSLRQKILQNYWVSVLFSNFTVLQVLNVQGDLLTQQRNTSEEIKNPPTHQDCAPALPHFIKPQHLNVHQVLSYVHPLCWYPSVIPSGHGETNKHPHCLRKKH